MDYIDYNILVTVLNNVFFPVNLMYPAMGQAIDNLRSEIYACQNLINAGKSPDVNSLEDRLMEAYKIKNPNATENLIVGAIFEDYSRVLLSENFRINEFHDTLNGFEEKFRHKDAEICPKDYSGIVLNIEFKYRRHNGIIGTDDKLLNYSMQQNFYFIIGQGGKCFCPDRIFVVPYLWTWENGLPKGRKPNDFFEFEKRPRNHYFVPEDFRIYGLGFDIFDF